LSSASVDLLLITGAGASRNLGKTDEPMPLMDDWSNALVDALEAAERGLAARCGLRVSLSGTEFEEALGLLLRWEAFKYLNSHFAEMTDSASDFQRLDGTATQRLGTLRRVLDQTMYGLFGQERVDTEAAAAAYGNLLRELKVRTLAVATTNYDRSCEAALSALNRTPDTGFRIDDSESVPRLDVRGLIRRAIEGQRTPCLHLHGAIGWYQKDRIVYDHKADHPYNQTLGTPVVLYPDPQKDPTNDENVAALWDEFLVALAEADRVLVLGHSLHDPALIAAIRAAQPKKLGVTFLMSSDAPEEQARIREQLPGATPVPIEFGAELNIDLSHGYQLLP